MKEASGTRYDVVGGNHLTDFNGVGQATGIIGNAGVFDAAKALYRASNTTLQAGSIDFTWSCWVYMTNKPAQYMGVIAKQSEYLLYYDHQTDRMLWHPAGYDAFANSLGSPQLNTWYYMVGWHDLGTGGFLLINDNYLDSDLSGTARAVNDNELDIGTFDNRNNPTIGWQGRIDEVAFWKRLLTDDEKTQLYNGGLGFGYPFGAVGVSRRALRGIYRGAGRGV